ncbi:hypothetical protein [Trinickia acidisoli]|uniref:hypothetical protein n=1 Tax=Trinickia acidisoli TaxID=2767482 RepID=UPI001A8E7A99|nr:hypothetical protein [Trinickia acidisoli]
MRARIVAVAVAGAVASLIVAADAQAQAPLRERGAEHPHPFRPFQRRYLPPAREGAPRPPPASAPPASIFRTASAPGEFGDHQRDGHMTPEERRLLRQHIEDAVRELYKR